MMLKLLIIGSLLIYGVVCNSKFQPPWMFMGRPLSGFRQTFVDQNAADTIASLNESQPLMFTQMLDHSSSKNETFLQRYWHNSKYSKAKGPHFLIINGESEASSTDIFWEQYPHVTYAKESGAGLWLLEHRYYGKSTPFENLTIENLQYLDTNQALHDIAQFIIYQNDALNLSDPQWVVFGGGAYAGALALWFRELYPQLAIGAVASSPMVNLKLDFYEYLANIEDAYSKATSWCSADQQNHTCADILRSAFSSLDDTFTSSESSDVLQAEFKFSPPTFALKYPQNDGPTIYSSLTSYLQIPVQYGNVNANLFNQNNLMETMCDTIVRNCGNNFYTALANAIHTIMGSMQKEDVTLHVDYDGLVKYLKVIDQKDPLQASTRAWLWQVCNEFGSFPSTSNKSMFLHYDPVDFYAGVCADVFSPKFTLEFIQEGIDKTLTNFGGNNYSGTNVIISQGSEDPWRTLSLDHSPNDSVIRYTIEGAGHASDMAPVGKNDSESLVSFRKVVLANLQKWLYRTSEKCH